MQDKDIIIKILQDIVETSGLQFWGCEISKEVGGYFVELYIENNQNSIQIDDCVTISKKVQKNSSLMNFNIRLDVSSPGINRKLFTIDQYDRYIGSKVSVKLSEVFNNKNKFIGEINGVIENTIIFKLDSGLLEVPFNSILKVKLVS